MDLKVFLEQKQATIYCLTMALGAAAGLALPDTTALRTLINPAIAIMLFATFLQVPLTELGRAFRQIRFSGALLTANFVVLPLGLLAAFPLLPEDPLIRLGVALVLLAPCIDYVVTFAHLGKADAKLILAATPVLLVGQMVLLGPFLEIFPGVDARNLVEPGPFLHALFGLIAVPLLLAALCQTPMARHAPGPRLISGLGFLPVPATAGVLFLVVASVMPELEKARDAALAVVAFYVAFATIAPLTGWVTARCFRLEARAAHAVAFSAGTRNSLVVLPLALAIPGALPVVPAVIVTQTLVELLFELLYIRLIKRLPGPAGHA